MVLGSDVSISSVFSPHWSSSKSSHRRLFWVRDQLSNSWHLETSMVCFLMLAVHALLCFWFSLCDCSKWFGLVMTLVVHLLMPCRLKSFEYIPSVVHSSPYLLCTVRSVHEYTIELNVCLEQMLVCDCGPGMGIIMSERGPTNEVTYHHWCYSQILWCFNSTTDRVWCSRSRMAKCSSNWQKRVRKPGPNTFMCTIILPLRSYCGTQITTARPLESSPRRIPDQTQPDCTINDWNETQFKNPVKFEKKNENECKHRE